MMETINVLSIIVAIIATIYLFVLSAKCTAGLKKGFLLLALGTFVTIGLHSIFSLIYMVGRIEMNLWMNPMYIQIFVGSILIIAGTYTLYNTISSVGKKQVKK